MPRNDPSPTSRRPWGTVRRDGPRANALVALSAERGVTLKGKVITGRKVEELSGDGFIPDDNEEAVTVIRMLDVLGYGPGKSGDETALRLLAQGLGLERARAVLVAGSPDLSQLDGETLPPEVTDALDSGTGSMRTIAPVLQQVLKALADAPIGGRETYAGEPLTETPDTRKTGFFDDVGRMMTGKTVANPELLYDVAYHPEGPFGPDPKRYQRVAQWDEIEVVEDVTAQLGTAFAAYPEIVTHAPITLVAQAAVVARAMFSTVPDDVVPGFDDRGRDLLAAWMAPLLLGMREAGWAPHPSKAVARCTTVVHQPGST